MYHHLRAHERDLIAVWKGRGLSNKQIAKRLNRSVSSIGREIKRNRRPDGYYVSIRAQLLAKKRQLTAKRRHPLKSPVTFAYVLEKLKKQLVSGTDRRQTQERPGPSRHLSRDHLPVYLPREESGETALGVSSQKTKRAAETERPECA